MTKRAGAVAAQPHPHAATAPTKPPPVPRGKGKSELTPFKPSKEEIAREQLRQAGFEKGHAAGMVEAVQLIRHSQIADAHVRKQFIDLILGTKTK
jgi:hypothetical protein